MSDAFQVVGTNDKAPFTLTVHRGEGMALLAMDWKKGKPPTNFVGFGIEYKEPDGETFLAVKNRLCFPGSEKEAKAVRLSSLRSPIQKFRWVHFPRAAEKTGPFTYRVTAVFMNEHEEILLGQTQTVEIELRRETYPGQLNVAFTRGFVSSQAFVDRFGPPEAFGTLIPAKPEDGPTFVPTHPKAAEAMAWMGFEAREVILDLLDSAIKDKTAQVGVVAYDLNLPEVIERLEKLKKRVRVIIDDDGSHGKDGSGENQAAERLTKSAGAANVKRQHMGQLQHNKTIVVTGDKVNAAVCGSTNYSWRGFFVQANNSIVVQGKKAIQPFLEAFENYWTNENNVSEFSGSGSAEWTSLELEGIDAQVSFSPHSPKKQAKPKVEPEGNAKLDEIAKDIEKNTTSSLFFSLAFLYQTPGAMRNAIKVVTDKTKTVVYGISDRPVGGLDVQMPNGNQAVVAPAALTGKAVPEPFKSEPTGGGGVRMHHKFLVVDFDKPTARVYMGSYNFSATADTKNGENLLVIKDRRVATAYMVEALQIFDHYHFRVAQQEAKKARKSLGLQKPPAAGEKAWWDKYYTDPVYVRDRQLFSQAVGKAVAAGQ